MDRVALETLAKAHQSEIYRYMRYLGAHDADAEDLVQDTFLAAFRTAKVPAASDTRGQAAWLRTIARNRFISHYRRRKASPVDTSSERLERAEAVWVSEFLRDGDGSDYLDALRQCLDALPEKSREALDLRYAARKSREEMAQILNLTESGVKSLLRRIRGVLAECIRKRLALEST
jgi:RNA polymerase sigma-70 factor (ECF subfamily)